MKTISIVAKRGKPEAIALAKQLHARYPDLTFLAEPEVAEALGLKPSSPAELCARCDLMVVLGGDGTLIQAARILKAHPDSFSGAVAADGSERIPGVVLAASLPDLVKAAREKAR